MHINTRAIIAYAAFGFVLTTKAQSNFPQCVMSCLSNASQNVGCSGPEDWSCACKQSSFQTSAERCFTQACSSSDAQIGQSLLDTGCSNEATTSIPAPFSPPATSSSLTVTDSLTSPPESSPPSSPAPSLVPPTPPPSTTGANSATQPAPSSTVAPPLSTGSPGMPTSSPGSSIINGPVTATNSTTAANSTVTTNATSNALTPSIGSLTVPSGTVQSLPTTTTSSSGALHMAAHSETVTGVVLSLVGLWAFL